MYIVSLSSKNQITLPQTMLYALGIPKRSKLLIDKTDDGLLIKTLPIGMVDSLGGSLTALVSSDKKQQPFVKIMQVTRLKVARKLVK